MTKYVIVFDLDECLCFWDEQNCISKNSSYYLRPFARFLLRKLETHFKPNKYFPVLFSYGLRPYVMDVLNKFDILKYFKLVLTRKHCEISKGQYGAIKTFDYLIRRKEVRRFICVGSSVTLPVTIIIDDKVRENTENVVGGDFDLKICVPEFNAVNIVNKINDRALLDAYYRIVNYDLSSVGDHKPRIID